MFMPVEVTARSSHAAALLLLSAVSTAAEDIEDEYNDVDADEFEGDGSSAGGPAIIKDLKSIMLIVAAVMFCVTAFIVYVVEKFGKAPRKRFKMKKRGRSAPLRSLKRGTHIKSL